jgi:GNAT superfamily N-acetyltransferase
MNSNVTIRPATRADAESIRRLVVGLAEYEKLEPPDEEAQARLLDDAFRERPRVEIYLAEVGGEVVGYAFVFETYSTFLALPTLYLEDLFVMPGYRNIGAGYALFSYCARLAVKRGCGRMEWTVLAWNRLALDFYSRLGATHLQDWLLYRLDGEALARFGRET